MKSIVFTALLTLATSSYALEKLPAGHPPVNTSNAPVAAPAALPQTGKVMEVITVPQYTYIQVSQDKDTVWLAGPSIEVKKGDTVHFDNGLVMKDFHSNSLERTFPSILFVNRIVVGD